MPEEYIFKASDFNNRGFWQRYQDLNPDKQSQSLLCYPYTIPLYFAALSERQSLL